MKQVACPDCNTVVTVKQLIPGESVECTSCHHTVITVPENYNPVESTRCPYCGEQIASDEPSIFCPVCKIEHHLECWQDNKGCTTYGCEMHDCLKPKLPPITPQAAFQMPPNAVPNSPNSIPQPSGNINYGNFGNASFTGGMPNSANGGSNGVKNTFLVILKVLGYTLLSGVLCLILGLITMGIGMIFTTIGSLVTSFGVFLRDLIIVVEYNSDSPTTYSFRLQYYSIIGFLVIGILIHYFSSTLKEFFMNVWKSLKNLLNKKKNELTSTDLSNTNSPESSDIDSTDSPVVEESNSQTSSTAPVQPEKQEDNISSTSNN